MRKMPQMAPANWFLLLCVTQMFFWGTASKIHFQL